MATGTGNLPNQNMSFSPYQTLTAEEQNQLVQNIEAVANGSGIGDEAITPAKIEGPTMGNPKLENATTTTFSIGWMSPTFTKIGRLVFYSFAGNATVGASGDPSETVPLAFRPAVETVLVAGVSNGDNGRGNAAWRLNTNGTITFFGQRGLNTYYLSGVYISAN